MGLSNQKRSELSMLLRRLADYVDNRSDEELAPLFELAQRLKPKKTVRRRDSSSSDFETDRGFYQAIWRRLAEQQTREAGEALLRDEVPNRMQLEVLARTLQLPVQSDDTLARLRTKIVENIIGSRLRSQAIQGGGKGNK